MLYTRVDACGYQVCELPILAKWFGRKLWGGTIIWRGAVYTPVAYFGICHQDGGEPHSGSVDVYPS